MKKQYHPHHYVFEKDPLRAIAEYFDIDSLPAWRQWVQDLLQAAGTYRVYPCNATNDLHFECACFSSLIRAVWKLYQPHPYRCHPAIRAFFQYMPPEQWLRQLRTLRCYALRAVSLFRAGADMDMVGMYLLMAQLLEAAWALQCKRAKV
jgi:hypothetical protein